VIVAFGTCDLPAKAMVLNTTQYNGASGCQVCEDIGERLHVTEGDVSEDMAMRLPVTFPNSFFPTLFFPKFVFPKAFFPIQDSQNTLFPTFVFPNNWCSQRTDFPKLLFPIGNSPNAKDPSLKNSE